LVQPVQNLEKAEVHVICAKAILLRLRAMVLLSWNGGLNSGEVWLSDLINQHTTGKIIHDKLIANLESEIKVNE